jgi:hypothetical protein
MHKLHLTAEEIKERLEVIPAILEEKIPEIEDKIPVVIEEKIPVIKEVIKEEIVDQVYNAGSVNAQSGKAVAEALSQFDPSINEEQLVGKKTDEGGEIFNDYRTNQALGTFSHSEGTQTQAGSKAFTVLGIDKENRTYTLDSVEGLEVNDIYSVALYFSNATANQKENVGKITAIDAENNTVTVDVFYAEEDREFAIPESYINEFGVDEERNTFRIIAKPLVGTRNIGFGTHSEGQESQALAKGSHAEGDACVAYGPWSHAEGKGTKAGYSAHAEGKSTVAAGFHSHAEGTSAVADGWASHAEGAATKSIGSYSHAEGNKTEAKGLNSHAEGSVTVAEGSNSHAEGSNTLAKGNRSHAEGKDTVAEGHDSHAGGVGTKATTTAQTAVGKYNTENADALYIVGNGTSDIKRNNAFVVYNDGTAEVDKQGNTDKSVVNLKYANETYANAYKISEEKDIVTLEDVSDLAASSVTVINNVGKSVTLSDAKFVKADIIDSIDFNSDESVKNNFTKVETSKFTFDLSWNEDEFLHLHNNMASGTSSYIYRDIEVDANSNYCLAFDFRLISNETSRNTSFGVFGINDDGSETQFERNDYPVTAGIGYITNSSITLNNSTKSHFVTSVTKTNHFRYIQTTPKNDGTVGDGIEKAKLTFSTGPYTKIRIKYYPNGVDRNCYISNWRIFKMTEIEGLSINSNGSLSLTPEAGTYTTDTAGLDINYSYTKDTKALLDSKTDKTYVDNKLDSKVDKSSLYIEEQTPPVMIGYGGDNASIKFFENAKGGTSIQLSMTPWEYYNTIGVYGTNFAEPITFNEAISGVKFTNRADGGIDVKGTATDTQMVQVTREYYTNALDDILATGMGLYVGIYDDSEGNVYKLIPSEGAYLDDYFIGYSNSSFNYWLSFKLIKGETYNLTIYPMMSAGRTRRNFEAYKYYGVIEFDHTEDYEKVTNEYTFIEDGNYTLIEGSHEMGFSCSNYTKITDTFMSVNEKEQFVTDTQLEDVVSGMKLYVNEYNTNICPIGSKLTTNTICRGAINETISFILPTDIDNTVLNSIELQVTISNYDSISIDLGATKYFGDIPVLGNGDYIIYYEHNGIDWCVGALNITAGE